MAVSFRRRIKIAPGINLNLSKKGVGVSVGPRGAKVSIGPNGTYLHTGIPGTGIYSRTKLSPSVNKSPESPTPAVELPPQEHFEDIPKDTSNNKGCGNSFIWILLIVSFVALVAVVSNIRNTNEALVANAFDSSIVTSSPAEDVAAVDNPVSERILNELGDDNNKGAAPEMYRDENQVSLDELNKKQTTNYWVLAISIVLLLFSMIWLLVVGRSSSSDNSLSASKASTSKASDATERIINKLKGQIASAKTQEKKLVLNNYLGYVIKDDAEKRIKPLVDKWRRKVAKKPTPENEEQLKVYDEQYQTACKEAEQLILDIDSQLNDFAKNNYRDFCDAFQAFAGCNKVWRIISSFRNSEYKSSAYTTVKREQITLKPGSFPQLKSTFKVPSFPSLSKGHYYFYPSFVVCGDTIDNFDVLSLNEVSIKHSATRFIEDGVRPSDSKQVDTTYRYVNKNGGPDRRYSYNPSMPVLLYGDITIMPSGDTFQVSNDETALQLDLAFRVLKDGNKIGNSERAGIPQSDDSHIEKIDDDQTKMNPLVIDQDLSKAAYLVAASKNGSTSGIQRALSVGYSKAERLMSQLEMLGIVGPKVGDLPRQVIVTDLNKVSDILNKYSANPHSGGVITEQYFNDLLEAARRLLDFCDVLASDKDFCKIVDDTVSGNVTENGKILSNPADRLSIYLWLDVIRCYSGLGHELDLSSAEGLGILIFNTLRVRRDFELEYSSWPIIKEDLIVSNESFIRNALANTKGNRDLYILEVCLKDYNKRLHNKYVLLLYRFASLVAKADKTITAKEADWLNKIIYLKEPEELDDVITPVEPTATPKEKAAQRKPRSGAMKELNSLIGLDSVKSEINTLTNYIKVQSMRAEKGMKVTPVSYHCVFTGNPGTGKTTVARIVSEIYKELGILKKGHLVETDRSGLVAEYVGQTAVKTNKIIDSALDGILFIDEAYSLVDGGNSDYGKEAISTLLKRMEDNRDRLVVILAGYTADMKRFIESNPGLQSRFNRYIEFPDYSAEELYQIFESNTKKYEYRLTEGAISVLKEALNKAVESKDKNFGNGRFVRNLFEKVVEHQANRISAEADITADSLSTIEDEDINKSL